MRKHFLILILLFLTGYLTAQTNTSYVISEVTIDLASKAFSGGNTNHKLLKARLGIQVGTVFADQNALNDFIAAKDKAVKDLPIMTPDGKVTYQLLNETDEDGHQKINVTIKAKEAFNFFVLPYPKYDSNDGLKIGLRLRHFNFLGFMNTLYGSLTFQNDENSKKSFEADVSFTIPLQIGKKQWDLSVGVYGKYAGDSLNPNDPDDMDDEIFRTYVGMGTWWNLEKTGRYRIYTSITESFSLLAGRFYGRDEDRYYFSTSLYAGIPVPIVQVPWWGWFYYQVGVGGSTYYRFDKAVKDKRVGFFPYVNNNFWISNVERVVNFRKGLAFNFGINNSFDPAKARNYGVTGDRRTGPDQYAWKSTVYVNTAGYLPINKTFAVKGRIGWEYSIFRDNDDDLGSPVRGIRDDRMRGDMLLYWNVDFIMNIYLWKLAVLGEAHASIFVDGGMTRDFRGKWNQPFNAVGIELVLYPAFTRSMQLRLSFGEDLYALIKNKDIRGSSPRDKKPQHELYIGLDLHY